MKATLSGRSAGWSRSRVELPRGSRIRDMDRCPGQLSGPHPDTVTMPKGGNRLKFRAHDTCSGQVTMADYANPDPAVVRSGWEEKAMAIAVQQKVKSLCGLEAFQVPAEEALSRVGEPSDIMDSNDEMDAQEESTQERAVSRKKEKQETQRRPGWGWRRRVSYGYLAAAGFLYPS